MYVFIYLLPFPKEQGVAQLQLRKAAGVKLR